MAGGIILIVIGFDLLRDRIRPPQQEDADGDKEQDEDIKKRVKRRFQQLVVPIAIPLIDLRKTQKASD